MVLEVRKVTTLKAFGAHVDAELERKAKKGEESA
jgi:hypothetical protein